MRVAQTNAKVEKGKYNCACTISEKITVCIHCTNKFRWPLQLEGLLWLLPKQDHLLMDFSLSSPVFNAHAELQGLITFCKL